MYCLFLNLFLRNIQNDNCEEGAKMTIQGFVSVDKHASQESTLSSLASDINADKLLLDYFMI